MVWALFLIISGEQIREGFSSHMIATYKTVQECDKAAYDLTQASRQAKFGEITYYYLMERGGYRCAPIPQQ